MKKFFITGVPGIGKTSVGESLSLKGISVIDIDSIEGLCQWVNNNTQEIEKWNPGMTDEWYKNHKYICDKELLTKLINNYNDTVVVVGMPSNRHDLLDLFDKTFLLQSREETFLKRLTNRTNSNFGKHTSDRENVLTWYKNFEMKMLERGAIPINADLPLADVVEEIYSHL
ncbi:MAG: AAA family ATPase [Candidatus Paceibacterota bacterium]|jgi:broad-specificity NMP kinase